MRVTNLKKLTHLTSFDEIFSGIMVLSSNIRGHISVESKRFTINIDGSFIEKIDLESQALGITKKDFIARIFDHYFSKKDDVLTAKDVEKYEEKIKELKDYTFKLHDKYDKSVNECMALKEALAHQSELDTEPIPSQEEQEPKIPEKKRSLHPFMTLSHWKHRVKYLPRILFLAFCFCYFITRYGSVSTDWERYVVYHRYYAQWMDWVIGDQALPMSILLRQGSEDYEKIPPKTVLNKLDYEPYYFDYFWGSVRETLVILFAGLLILLYRFLTHRYKE